MAWAAAQHVSLRKLEERWSGNGNRRNLYKCKVTFKKSGLQTKSPVWGNDGAISKALEKGRKCSDESSRSTIIYTVKRGDFLLYYNFNEPFLQDLVISCSTSVQKVAVVAVFGLRIFFFFFGWCQVAEQGLDLIRWTSLRLEPGSTVTFSPSTSHKPFLMVFWPDILSLDMTWTEFEMGH